MKTRSEKGGNIYFQKNAFEKRKTIILFSSNISRKHRDEMENLLKLSSLMHWHLCFFCLFILLSSTVFIEKSIKVAIPVCKIFIFPSYRNCGTKDENFTALKNFHQHTFYSIHIQKHQLKKNLENQKQGSSLYFQQKRYRKSTNLQRNLSEQSGKGFQEKKI